MMARHTALEMEPIGGEACRYRTTQDVELWPIAVVAAELGGRPLVAPPGPHVGTVRRPACGWCWNAWLRARVSPIWASTGCGSSCTACRSMRPGCTSCCATTCSGVALADHPEDLRPVFLGPSAVGAGGFAAEEGLLPYLAARAGRLPPARRVFLVPAEIPVLRAVRHQRQDAAGRRGGRLEIFFYFDRAVPGLERQVTADSLALGCTPIVNLFTQRAEPVALTHEPPNTTWCPTAGAMPRGRCFRSTG